MYKNPHPAHTMLADVIFKERWLLANDAKKEPDYVMRWDTVLALTKKYTRREMLATIKKLGLHIDNDYCWAVHSSRPIKEMGEIITNYVMNELNHLPDWMIDPASRLPVSSIDYGED